MELLVRDSVLADYGEYAEPNWDGYGADPITPDTLVIGRALAALFEKPPHAAPGGDGTVGFEWVDLERGHKVFFDAHHDYIGVYVRVGDVAFTTRSQKKYKGVEIESVPAKTELR